MSRGLDPRVIESMREIGGDALLRRMLRVFLVTSSEAMQRIDAALSQGLSDRIQVAAHHLYASAAQLRLSDLADIAENLEKAARANDIPAAQGFAEALRRALTIARADLGLVLDALPKAPRVAVIEDSEDMRILLHLLLESHFDVTAYSNATSAIADLQRFPPDLMLIDVCLPDVNGIDVLQAVRSDPLLSGIPAVALTALTPPEGESYADRGFDLHIPKPILDSDAMIQSLNALLKSKPA
jgi:CheY-like chemotaxis protein